MPNKKTSPPPKEFTTETELASRLGRSRTTLQNWRRLGNGPPFQKLGGRISYRTADVQAWIEASTRTRAAS